MFNVRIIPKDPECYSDTLVIIYVKKHCNLYDVCKYKNDCSLANRFRAQKHILKFLRNLFKIDIVISQFSSDFSGTITCPHKVRRSKFCNTCEFNNWTNEKCESEKRAKGNNYIFDRVITPMPTDPCYTECKYYQPVSWYMNYNKKTGQY